MKRWNFLLAIAGLSSFALACSEGGDNVLGALPPADKNSPTVVAPLAFDHPWYDELPERGNKCRWFDGMQNSARQVDVRVLSMNTDNGTLYDLYPVQTFVNGRDFFYGNPGSLGITMPRSGGFFLEVTVYGEPDSDCCPGAPPGRPLFRAMHPYDEYGGVGRFNVPRFVQCLYF